MHYADVCRKPCIGAFASFFERGYGHFSAYVCMDPPKRRCFPCKSRLFVFMQFCILTCNIIHSVSRPGETFVAISRLRRLRCACRTLGFVDEVEAQNARNPARPVAFVT